MVQVTNGHYRRERDSELDESDPGREDDSSDPGRVIMDLDPPA